MRHLGLDPGPEQTQSRAGAQAGHELALVSSAPLDIERLIAGFVRDANLRIIAEVNPQGLGNLLR